MLYIRADMNNVIATGHMMRCLSIADAATKFGESTTFILADEQAVELIRSADMRQLYFIPNGRTWRQNWINCRK